MGNLNDPNFINKGLFKLLSNIDLWKAAYLKLAKSKGSITPYINRETIDGASLMTLSALKDDVINGTYKVGITKRVIIPKPGKAEMRQGINPPALKDRVVQEVLRTILEVIYEPIFSNHSHGFRPQRSQHTALRHIRANSSGFIWCVEGKLNSIDHQILINLLQLKIKDPKFLKLIHLLLKIHSLGDWRNEKIFSTAPFKTGSPQGSILSPLLSNIYWHSFDLFIENLIKEFNKATKKKRNNEYDPNYYIRPAALGAGDLAGVKLARAVPYGDPFSTNFKRIHYVRYADDFIITVDGSLKDAEIIKGKCGEFLQNQLKLILEPNKTKISHASKGFKFLGHIIKKSTAAPKKYSYIRKFNGIPKVVHVLRGNRVYLKADIQKTILWLSGKGYCDKAGFPQPNFIHLPENQKSAIQKVSLILHGINSYYKLCENRRHFVSRINYILRYSLAKLFAAKFKLKTVAKVFKRAGKDLGKPLKNAIGITDENLAKIADCKSESTSETKKTTKTKKTIPKGVPYTKYKEIPKPDLAPLNQNFNSLTLRV